MKEYALTISAKALKSIIGDVNYKRLSVGILRYYYPSAKVEEPIVLVDSIPLHSMSREARAAILNLSKKVQPTTNEKNKTRKELGQNEKLLLQNLIDERCRVVTERYIEKRNKLSSEYLRDMMKPEFRAALSQYPVPYTDPRTVLYFESFDSLYQDHHDEMRRLLCICETLGLRTNPLLDHVLGCSARSHRYEPQAGQDLL